MGEMNQTQEQGGEKLQSRVPIKNIWHIQQQQISQRVGDVVESQWRNIERESRFSHQQQRIVNFETQRNTTTNESSEIQQIDIETQEDKLVSHLRLVYTIIYLIYKVIFLIILELRKGLLDFKKHITIQIFLK